MKERSIRLFRDTAKAIYNEGPYQLFPPFKKFYISHDHWMDMSRQEKETHLQQFFSYIPTVEEVENSNIIPPPDKRQTVDEKKKNKAVMQPTVMSDSSEKPSSNIPFSAEDLNIDEHVIPKETLKNIFKEAERLLSTKDAITKAASSDERLRTVANSNGAAHPYIVSPMTKNRDYLMCKCKTFEWYCICPHALAAAQDIGICFNFLTEAKKKLESKKGKKRGLTTALNSDLRTSEKGLKKDEIQKRFSQKKTSTESNTINSRVRFDMNSKSSTISSNPISHSITLSNSQLIQSQPKTTVIQQERSFLTNNFPQTANTFLYPYRSQSQTNNLLNSQLENSFHSSQNSLLSSTQTNLFQPSPPMVQPLFWNSGMSPYKYELVPLPQNVVKCYGCGHKFVDSYRTYPNNLIIRHRDRRIIGKNQFGGFEISPDFQFTYYHLKKEHVVKKNPEFENNPIVYTTSTAYACFMKEKETVDILNKSGIILLY